jgi:hypothetical protein
VTEIQPKGLRAQINRDPHRSPTFQIQFDISPLLDERNRPLVEGDVLEEMLVEWCRQGIRTALAEGRAKVSNHP